jgi:hypothetical protein
MKFVSLTIFGVSFRFLAPKVKFYFKEYEFDSKKANNSQ